MSKVRLMFKISDISEGLTEIIRRNLSMDEVKLEQIEYGIYMAISETTKVVAVLIIAALLDIFKYAVLTIVVFGIHRGFIGGVHAKTHWGCFLSYCAIIFGSVYSALYLVYLDLNRIVIFIVLYPLCMLIAYKYAPADIENKPVVSKRQRRYLRIGGFIFLSLVFLASLFVPQPYANILVFITLIECITMLPIVYRITGNKYGYREEV